MSALVFSQAALWLTAAGVLVVMELATGTFYLLVLGIAALIGAFGAWTGVTLTMQLAAFALVAVLLVATRMPAKLQALLARRSQAIGSDVGEKVTVVGHERDGLRVRYRGTEWTARTLEGGSPAIGSLLEIVRVDGITLVCREVPPPA